MHTGHSHVLGGASVQIFYLILLLRFVFFFLSSSCGSSSRLVDASPLSDMCFGNGGNFELQLRNVYIWFSSQFLAQSS